MKHFKFYKYQERWYVDLPEWDGSIDDLEMVCGADTLLDIIAQGEDKTQVSFSEPEIDNFKYSLTKLREEEFSGATYIVEGNNITPFEAWLCDVSKWIFGYHPNKFYLI